jgi:predicted lipopolysaccharide heptosyltransferase III
MSPLQGSDIGSIQNYRHFACGASISRSPSAVRKPPLLAKSVKILLLQLKRIGDLILTTPAVAALRERFRDAEMTMVVSGECADLLPAISGVDRILMARRDLRDLGLFFAVAGKRFDYCIDFTRNDRTAFLAFLSRARKRIVSYRVRDQSKSRARLYTDFVDVRARDLHTIDYNLALLEPLGIRDVSCPLQLQLPQPAHEKADALRRNWNVNKPYLVLHPGSARQEKLWEAGRWAQMIERFGRDDDFDLVLTSGASKHEQVHIAAIKNETQQQVIDLSGKTDLLTLAALIGQAQLLVTVDSAPMHLAAATHTPQVILFGPTNPFHWRPKESPALILQGKSPEPVTEFSPAQPRLPVSQISTEAVMSAMDLLLSRHAAARTS